MEEEAEKLKQMQTDVDKQLMVGSSPQGSQSSLNMSFEEKMEVDGRSVYVGNVDYAATAEELEQHFHGCGAINRVTILCNKFDGHPKGFAYVEFTDKDSIGTAMALDDSLFRGRQIKVMGKKYHVIRKSVLRFIILWTTNASVVSSEFRDFTYLLISIFIF